MNIVGYEKFYRLLGEVSRNSGQNRRGAHCLVSIMLIHTSWTHWVSYLGNQTPQKWVLDCGGLMLGRLVPPPSGAYRASLGSSGLKVNLNRTWTGGFLGPGLYVQKTFIVYIESVSH